MIWRIIEESWEKAADGGCGIAHDGREGEESPGLAVRRRLGPGCSGLLLGVERCWSTEIDLGWIGFRRRGEGCFAIGLDAEEPFFPPEQVQEEPLGEEDAGGEDEGGEVAAVAGEAAEEEVGEVVKIEEAGGDVDGDGIGPDDGEGEGEPFCAEDVDHGVEDREEDEAVAAGDEDEGAGPEILDDRKDLAPGGADGEAEDTGDDKAEGLAGGFVGG